MTRQLITRRDLLEVFLGILLLVGFFAAVWLVWGFAYALEPRPEAEPNTRPSAVSSSALTGR